MTEAKESDTVKKQLAQPDDQEPSTNTQERPGNKGGVSDEAPSEHQEMGGGKRKFRPSLPRLATAAVKMYLVPTPVHRSNDEKKIAIENSMEKDSYRSNERRSKCSYFLSKVLSVLPYVIIGFALGMAMHFLLEWRDHVNERPVPVVPSSLIQNLPAFNNEPLRLSNFPYYQKFSNAENEGKDEVNMDIVDSQNTVSEQPQTSTSSSSTETLNKESESSSTEEPALSIKVKTDFLNPKFSEILSKLTAPILESATQFMNDPSFPQMNAGEGKDDATDIVRVESPAPGVMVIGRVHGNIEADDLEMNNVMDNAMKGLFGKLFGHDQRPRLRPLPFNLIESNPHVAEEDNKFRAPVQIQQDISQAPPPFIMEQISNIVKNVPGKVKSVRVTSSFTPHNPFQRLLKNVLGPSITEMIPEDETIYPDPPFNLDQINSMSVARPRAVFGRTMISRPVEDDAVRLFPSLSQSRPTSFSQLDSVLREFPKTNEEQQRVVRLSSVPAPPHPFPRVSIERLPPPILSVRHFHSNFPQQEQHSEQAFEAPEVQQEKELKSFTHQHEHQQAKPVLLKDIISARNPFSNQIFRNDKPDFLGLNFPSFPDIPETPVPESDPFSDQNDALPPSLVLQRRVPPFHLMNRHHPEPQRHHRRLIAIPREFPLNVVEGDSQSIPHNWVSRQQESREEEQHIHPAHVQPTPQHQHTQDFDDKRPEEASRPFLPLPILNQLPPNQHSVPHFDKINKDDEVPTLESGPTNHRKFPPLFLPFLQKLLPVFKPLNRNRHQFHPESGAEDNIRKHESVLPTVVTAEEPTDPEPQKDAGIWNADSYSSYDSIPSDTISSLPMMGFASVPGTDTKLNGDHGNDEDSDEDINSEYPEFSPLPAEIVEPVLEIDGQEVIVSGTKDFGDAEKSVFIEEAPDMEVQNDKIQEHVVFPEEPAAATVQDFPAKESGSSAKPVDVPGSAELRKQMSVSPVKVEKIIAVKDSDIPEGQSGMVDVNTELEAVE